MLAWQTVKDNTVNIQPIMSFCLKIDRSIKCSVFILCLLYNRINSLYMRTFLIALFALIFSFVQFFDISTKIFSEVCQI